MSVGAGQLDDTILGSYVTAWIMCDCMSPADYERNPDWCVGIHNLDR